MRDDTATPEVCLPSGFLDETAKEIAAAEGWTFSGGWERAWERHLDAEVAALNLPPVVQMTVMEFGSGFGPRGAYIDTSTVLATVEEAAELEAMARWTARVKIAAAIVDRIEHEEWKLGIEDSPTLWRMQTRVGQMRFYGDPGPEDVS